MKNTIKNLYNINPKALIKYTDKVYKIKDEDESEYCLKYVDCPCNNMIVEKMNTLNLSENFEMPIKTCVRSNQFNYDNKVFYVSKWVEDDLIESKDLKLKYYISKLGELHKKSSYTLNVTTSYFTELTMKIDEQLQQSFNYYENLVYIIERKEYKSPFEWFYIEKYKDIVESLNKARNYLDKLKKEINEKLVVRQVIGHLNFSYDHIFISKDKIIGNDKLKQIPLVYDLKSLFDKIDFGSIDISLLLQDYFKNIILDDYEIYWLFSLLYAIDPITFSNNEFINISVLNNICFKYKSINELEDKIKK